MEPEPLKGILTQLTEPLVEVLDHIVAEAKKDNPGANRNATIEDILRRSKRVRDAARQLGIKLGPRPKRGVIPSVSAADKKRRKRIRRLKLERQRLRDGEIKQSLTPNRKRERLQTIASEIEELESFDRRSWN